MEPVMFTADKVKINAPLADGGGSVTFSIGEYMIEQVIDLLKIPQQTALKVRVEIDDGR